MNKYETIYIVQPDVAEEQLDGIVQAFEAIIPENNGTLLKTDKWGKRRLAYRIGSHWEGSYVLHEYEGDGSTQRELERRMRIHEHIIRHMTVAVDPRMAVEIERRAAREKRMDHRRDDAPRTTAESRSESKAEERKEPPKEPRKETAAHEEKGS